MIEGMFLDKDNYPVNETFDGMDSAVREGILQICKPPEWEKIRDPENYEMRGYLVRHPLMSPAYNEWNNTRDNMIPMIAGLFARGKQDAIRRVFWRIVKRGFFAQNFERDVRFSRKLPYPHYNYKDSRPTAETFPFWRKKEMLESPNIQVEFRWFDWADPFMPDQIAMLIKATGYKILYPLMIPGLIWFWLTFWVKKNKSQANVELNQLFCQCYVLGPYWLKKIKTLPYWASSFNNYWVSRNEGAYSDMIYAYLKKL